MGKFRLHGDCMFSQPPSIKRNFSFRYKGRFTFQRRTAKRYKLTMHDKKNISIPHN